MARTGQRFGEPLPRQLPDRPQPHPRARRERGRAAFGRETIPGLHAYRVLAPVSRGCPRPEGRLATCY
jgi:hypothetical protein